MKDTLGKLSTLVPALAVVASLFCGITPAIAADTGDSVNIPTVEEARLCALRKQSAGYVSDVNEVLGSAVSKISDSLKPAKPNAWLSVDFSNYFSNVYSGTPALQKTQELLGKKGWTVNLPLAQERWGYLCFCPAKELPQVDAYLLDDNEYNTVLASLTKAANANVEGNSSSIYNQDSIPTPDQALLSAFKQTRASFVDCFNDALNRIAWATKKLDLDHPGAEILVLDMERNDSGEPVPPKFMVEAQRVARAKSKGQWEVLVSPSSIFGQGFWQLSIRPVLV